ncbi:MAG: hypothetical protein ACSHYB_15730 [Roseibacillus sp.]
MRTFLAALVAPFFLSSCAQFFVKEKTYETAGGSEVNGAAVTSAVKGMGGKAGISVSAMVYNAATGETDGPFLWRIEARGQEGVHESLTVHSLRVKTEKTKRNEPFPSKWLNKAAPFEEMKGKKNEGVVFAKFQLPGKLEVFPEVDGQITMEADLSVKANGRTERKKLSFVMEPQVGRRNEMIFLPKEIVTSFGKKDPTEWTWNNTPGADRYGDEFWGADGRGY